MNHTPFKALAVCSPADDHSKMSTRAQSFLQDLASENGFTLDFSWDAAAVTTSNLEIYQVFIMLHLAPFELNNSQQQALQRFIEGGNGWVGIHAAGLTGKEFLAPQAGYWQWYEDFLGGVTYTPHPAYQTATAIVEDRDHPATRNLPDNFQMADEWYEFSASPRSRVRVLISADESTYEQNTPMGDHPIVWTNELYRRAIYVGLGHDPCALAHVAYRTLLRDFIIWAGSK